MQKEIQRKFFGNMNNIGKRETGKMSFQYVGVGDFFLNKDLLYMKVSENKAFLMSNEEQENKEIEFESDYLVTPTIVDFYCEIM